MKNNTATVSGLKPIDSVTDSTTPESVIRQAPTTQMLKLLSRLFPTYEWTSKWLHNNVKKNGYYSFKTMTLRYKEQPSGTRHEHLWEIEVDQKFSEKLAKAYTEIAEFALGQNILTATKPVGSLPGKVEYQKQGEIYSWNGLTFRSPAEIEIAKALESRGILFFANARCRIPSRQGTRTKETDFLVFYNGKSRILEVDGQEYHQNREEDYRRDRMFDKQGLRVTRFSASECIKDADGVVEEFLELYRN